MVNKNEYIKAVDEIKLDDAAREKILAMANSKKRRNYKTVISVAAVFVIIVAVAAVAVLPRLGAKQSAAHDEEVYMLVEDSADSVIPYDKQEGVAAERANEVVGDMKEMQTTAEETTEKQLVATKTSVIAHFSVKESDGKVTLIKDYDTLSNALNSYGIETNVNSAVFEDSDLIISTVIINGANPTFFSQIVEENEEEIVIEISHTEDEIFIEGGNPQLLIIALDKGCAEGKNIKIKFQ